MTDIPRFPGGGDEPPEEPSNVTPIRPDVQLPTVPAEPEQAEPVSPYRYGSAYERQLRETDRLVEVLSENRGDITVYGDIFRRFEVEEISGAPMGEEEFAFVSLFVNEILRRTSWQTLSIVVNEARRMYNNI